MKTFNQREIEQMLHKNGWTLKRHSGGHDIYTKGKETLVLGLSKCNKMITQRLIKTYNLDINL